MRTPALALLALMLAGCLSAPPPAPLAAPGATGGWALDCNLGSFERATDASWAQACMARASHTDGPKEETWLAVNPTDPGNVVIGAKDLNPASSKECVWNGVSVTHDAGATWRDVVIGGNYSDRQVGDPFWGYACNTDPMFRFDAKGDLHYAVEEYNLLGQNADGILPKSAVTDALAAASVIPGWKIVLATSHDGGDTWPDVITYQPDLVVITDYSSMTINPATQSILEMIGSAAGGCHILASRDGGQSADLFTIPLSTQGIPCAAIAASPDGTVALVGDGLLFGGGGLGRVVVARSTDDGRTWLDANEGFTYTPIQGFSESQYRVGSGMELAYDLTDGPRRGTLYALYGAADVDEADVFVRSSSDDGATWSDAVRVNDDDTTSHQWMGNLAVAGDGSVHAFFFDKRHDPAHKLIDITHAVSLDGGATWTNERVTSASFDGDLGVHQEGFPFIGDYIGVDAVGDHVWGGFPDASNGATTVIAAAHVRKG
ncbi:MAG TPA: sialidase family protein [Candidatus Thermoplasmatota archaeon]|nr:sialidase family protein [Candidatus Thermoplasmatota archaeon]